MKTQTQFVFTVRNDRFNYTRIKNSCSEQSRDGCVAEFLPERTFEKTETKLASAPGILDLLGEQLRVLRRVTGA